MWVTQKERLMAQNTPKDGDKFIVTADGTFIAYKRTERAAGMLISKLANSGEYSVVEWTRL